MKKIGLLMVLFIAVSLVTGCLTTQPSKPILVAQSTGVPGVGIYRRLPPPRSGLTIVINKNEHLEANCWLFQGYVSQTEMFAVHPETGQPVFAQPSILQFTIGPSLDRHQWRYKALQLAPSRANYTLFVIWARVGRIVDTEIQTFSTTGYPFNKFQLYSSPFRQVLMADRFVHLRRISDDYQTRFRIDKTIPLGQIIKDTVGIP